MIGFHFQAPQPNWTEAASRLPSGTPIKAIDNVQMLKDAKMANAGVVTILRHWAEPMYGEAFHPGSDKHDVARRFLASFVDGTFREYSAFVDYIEEFNEYLAVSQTPEEVAERIAWANAVAEIWANEYRTKPDMSHIRLILANTAVGNDIPWEFARIARDYNAVLGYHPYTPVRGGMILDGELPYYSGRWMMMDDEYSRRGYEVDWMFTEAGAVLYGVSNGGGIWLGPNDGWRHRDVYNANLQAYVEMIVNQVDEICEWNWANGGRAKGAVLFNSGNAGQWPLFQIQQPEMGIIAESVFSAVQGWTPPDDVPAEPDLNEAIWEVSVQNQCISLNQDAALQKRIAADGYVPVESEFRLNWYGQEYSCQAAEHLVSGDRRVYVCVVPRWDEIYFIGGPV